MKWEEYVGYLEKRIEIVWIDDIPWKVANRILMPLPMPHRMKPVDKEKVREAVGKTGSFFAKWSEEWDTAPCDWWWICCDDKEYDVAKLRKNVRRDVRAGLRRCEVRRIDPELFAREGYPVYLAAQRRRAPRVAPITSTKFQERALKMAGNPARELWGAFVGRELAAYAVCVLLDDAVDFTHAESDPKYHTALTNNAMIYTLTRHYLRERLFLYVTDGSRVIGHDTRIQDFLERMGYRRVYTPLKLVSHPRLSLLLKTGVGSWGKYIGLRAIMPAVMSKVSALSSLVKIAK